MQKIKASYFFTTGSTRVSSNVFFSKFSAVIGTNFGCPPEVPELWMNSEMGLAKRIFEVSPLAIRSMYGFIS